MPNKTWMLTIPGALLLSASPAWAVDLREAVQSALTTNPEIRQAVSNRAATEEELQQGKGLYYPRISVEGSAGVRNLRNPTRRELGIADHTLWPIEGDLIVDQLLFDSGGREAEVRRQAARSDAAAARVEERSEFVALNVSRTYIDYLLQQRLVAIAQDNVTFHERLAGDLREGVAKGSISIADQQQAEERLQAARARVTEAREDLDTAGDHVSHADRHSDRHRVDAAGSFAVHAADARGSRSGRLAANNPRVREAMADLATSREEIRAARAELGPKFNLEGRARAGHDIDGFEGRTTDLQALGVLRWTLYNGGTKEANVREQQERAERGPRPAVPADPRGRRGCPDARGAGSRTRPRLRPSSKRRGGSRTTCCCPIVSSSTSAGARCSTCSTRRTRATTSRQQAETARLAKLYAQYRVLAAENRLIECLGVQAPAAAQADGDGALSRQSDPAGGPPGKQHSGCRLCAPAPAAAPPVGGAPARDRRADRAERPRKEKRGRAVSFMHWLDAEPSREIDPVLDCLTFLARIGGPAVVAGPAARGARACRPTARCRSTRSSPRSSRSECAPNPVARRLKAWPSSKCPAVLELEDDRAAVLLEVRDATGLIYAPGLAEPMWVKLAELEPAYTGRAVVVEADPTRERENERPWDKAKRRHWFWSEVWKVRREFWPVLLAALIVNMLAFAMPLFTMNVYDRVIPNKAVATLWVLALGVMLALGFDFTLAGRPCAA